MRRLRAPACAPFTILGRAMHERRGRKRQPAELTSADFDFELPAELIAQQPPAERGRSRMLVMDRDTGDLRDDSFSCLSRYISAGRSSGPERQPRYIRRAYTLVVPCGGNEKSLQAALR